MAVASAWASVHRAIEVMRPGSFCLAHPPLPGPVGWFELVWFSMSKWPTASDGDRAQGAAARARRPWSSHWSA